MFHLLNNGLSAICQSYRLAENSLYVRDFQIVNGCQTTVTLWNTRAAIPDDPSVLVNLRLIECPEHFHKLIADTTNTQAPLRAEDFISTDKIQIGMQRQFHAQSPPWFYQVKRSEWSRMIGGPREKERYADATGNYRWLKSKDVAQAVVAFLGFPGEAKDKIRFFFDGTLSSEFGDLAYNDVYSEGLSAPQLLLPAQVYHNVINQVTQDKRDVEQGPNIDWLEYARLHLVWLIGELIRNKYRLPREIISKEKSIGLSETIDSWFPHLYNIARACLGDVVAQAKRESSFRGPREFFRSQGNYRTALDRLPDAVAFARQFGDPFSALPQA